MKLKHWIAAVVLTVAGVGLGAQATQARMAPLPEHTGFVLGTDFDTYNCITENSVGPNGWRFMGIGCFAPLQAHNKMFRAVAFLTDADGNEQRRNGPWRDCNGSASQPNEWIDGNFLHAHVFLEVVFDTKQGGC